jgi:class 3 adenylate cyclase
MPTRRSPQHKYNDATTSLTIILARSSELSRYSHRRCGGVACAARSAGSKTRSARSSAAIEFIDSRGGAARAENLEGERKTVTALFADLKGSTELEQNLDSEEARALV